MCIGIHVNYRLFLSDFNKKLNFLERFSKDFPQNSNFMKIRPFADEVAPCGRTQRDRRERHDEVNTRFWQFCESA